MKKQVVVVGLGRFGSNVAKALFQNGHEVLALDINERLVQEIMGDVTYAVQGDATDEAVLRELAVPNFDAGVVAIGSDLQANIMVTVLLKTLGLPYVAARAQNPLHGNTLERIGADKVIHPEEEMGVNVAHGLFNPDVQDYMALTADFGISRVKVPARFANMSLKESGFASARDKYGLAVLAIKRGNDVTINPDSDDKLLAVDILVVAGRDELLERLEG